MRVTDDQRELTDLVRRFFQDSVPPDYIRKRITSGLRRDENLLESLKALGLEEGFASDGGMFSCAELGLVAEEVGRALFPEPLVERLLGDVVILGLLSSGSREAYKAIGAGTAIAPVRCCQLKLNAKTKKISGEIEWAFGMEGARRLIGAVVKDGVEHLFACSLEHPGVSLRSLSSLDLTSALSGATLKDVPALMFSQDESAVILDTFEILKACEVYGVTSRVVEMSAEYLKTREQFGVPVGAFQAVQQRLADAYAQSESLGALCRFAAWSVKSSPEQRHLTAQTAIAQASEVGPIVCESAIQVHGGIGFTWEYDLHLYLRRAKAIEVAFPFTPSRVRNLLKCG